MATLDEIINSALSNDGSASGNTLVIHNHLAQLRLFGIRQGVEIYPDQDDEYDTRKKFIDKLWKQNQVELYLERMWDLMVCRGQILLYLRPTKSGSYRIYFYSASQFKPYYNGEGDLTEVCLRYSYKERTKFEGVDNTKWLRLRITADTIEQTQMDTQPSFDEVQANWNTVTMKNSLGFIPCVVVRNKPTGPGRDGVSEFECLRSQIETHDDMVGSMDENLQFFGNQSLVTTRTLNEVTEVMEGASDNLNRNVTMTSQGGWYSPDQESTNNHPSRGNRGRRSSMQRVKKVIGNVQGDERFGYIAPDPITPDHSQHLRETRECIHYALGGIDELGINASATAYEMKSIYGKVSATANKKAKAMYNHGICKLFEMALAAEEDLFRQSLAALLKKDINEVSDGFIQDLMAKQKIPPGVFGLPPLGNREIKWRWTGPVFEKSPRDLLDQSIVVRNFQELGVRSMEALKFFFDNKTEKEIEGMLSGGYPFRYISSIAGNLQQFLGMHQGMLGTPDPATGQPLAMSMPVTGLIQKSLETIYNELNYDRNFEPVAAGDLPNYNPGYANAAGFIPGAGVSSPGSPVPAGLPTASPGASVSNGFTPLGATGLFPIPFPTNPGQSLEGSVQFSGGVPGSTPGPQPEYAIDIPAAGSTVSTGATAQLPSSQLSPAAGVPAGIPADLAIGADQPGSLWQQLFPTFANALKPKSKSKRK